MLHPMSEITVFDGRDISLLVLDIAIRVCHQRIKEFDWAEYIILWTNEDPNKLMSLSSIRQDYE